MPVRYRDSHSCIAPALPQVQEVAMDIPILNSEQFWYCPNCDARARTVDASTPFHSCPKLYGFSSPLVREGVKARVDAIEREDYIGNELVQTDGNGRPIMSVMTTRDEGQDLAVYPATATGGSES